MAKPDCVRMRTIVTPELTLEPLCTSHAEAMFELLRDEAIYRYLDYSAPPSVQHLRDVYARLEARMSPDRSDAWLNWVIRPSGQPLVGYVQATVSSSRSAHVAYILASKYWGHGYAHRAMLAMLEYLASDYDVERCRATVEVENQRSVRLLERLGFQLANERELKGVQLSTTERMFVRCLAPKDRDDAHDRIASDSTRGAIPRADGGSTKAGG
jgi:RimJ/RimL family protein N-acetyltransferase